MKPQELRRIVTRMVDCVREAGELFCRLRDPAFGMESQNGPKYFVLVVQGEERVRQVTELVDPLILGWNTMRTCEIRVERGQATIIDDPLTVEEVDDGCELVDMAELAAALPSTEWDHTAEEAGAWISVFCAGWVDLAWFRANAWRYAWEEHYCYNEEDFEPEDNVGEDTPPCWWGKPEPGREGKLHQVGQARHVYVRRVPWQEVAGSDDDTFAWHLDVANKPGKEEGWFKATYMDLI